MNKNFNVTFQDYERYLETCFYPPKYENLQIDNESQKDHCSLINEDETNTKLPTYEDALKL